MKKINLRILAIDEGGQRLSLVETLKSNFIWTLDLSNFPQARDMQILENDCVLVGFENGFFEVNLSTGKIVSVCANWKSVTSVTRLGNGLILLTGLELAGDSGEVNVLTLDHNNSVIHVARRHGDYVRLMRTTPQGTYLLCMNDHIMETTKELNEIRRFNAQGFEHAWKADRLADGRTLISGGYGAFMALFDESGNLLKRFGEAASVPHEVAPYFYASHAIMPNGEFIVANWQGHGPNNGHKGCQLLQFSLDGALLATWTDPEKISSLQGILIV